MNWEINNGKLVKRFTLSSFSDVISRLQDLAKIADAMNHHPDFTVEKYKHIEFRLSTHDTQSITDKDKILAKEIDRVFGNP
jgi:4a-hydroxytetrahydrobiopterin dehydratase